MLVKDECVMQWQWMGNSKNLWTRAGTDAGTYKQYNCSIQRNEHTEFRNETECILINLLRAEQHTVEH